MRYLSLLMVLFFVGCGTDASDAAPDGAFVPDTGNACSAIECEPGYSCFAGECVLTSGCIDEDGDGYGENCEAGEDCDDTDPLVNPARAEVCDERDNNCDFYIDEDQVCRPCVATCNAGERLCSGAATVVCDDSLACPRFGNPTPCGFSQSCRDGSCYDLCVDADGDGFGVECPGALEDCDDSRDDVYPGAAERCDGIDNNCDRRVDENNVCAVACVDDCTAGARECSGDGRGRITCERTPDGCLRWSGVVSCGAGSSCSGGTCVDEVVCVDPDRDGAGPGCARADCRGADATSHPAATERCDGLDNNCNGVVDDGGVCATCVSATTAAPASVRPGAPLYRVGCGGAEYVRVESVGAGAFVAVVLAPATAIVDLGTLSGSYTAAITAERIGAAWVVFADRAPANPTLRINVRTSEAFAVSVAAAGTCVPDPVVPDNSPGSAVALGAGIHVGSAGLCANDFDFYQIDVAPGQIIEATIAYPATGSQLLLSVWRNGSEIVPSFGAGDGGTGIPLARRAHYRVEEPGRYVIGVRAVGAGANNYVYSVLTRPAPACVDDAGDPASGAQDDSVASARAGAPTGTIRGTLCPGDFDLISLGVLGAGGNLGGSFAPTGSGVQLLLLRDGWSAPRDFPSSISQPGTYYLAVFGQSSASTGTYTIVTQSR